MFLQRTEVSLNSLLWTCGRKKRVMCPKRSWAMWSHSHAGSLLPYTSTPHPKSRRSLDNEMYLEGVRKLHTTSSSPCLDRASAPSASSSPCPERTAKPPPVASRHSFPGPPFSSPPEQNACLYQRQTEAQDKNEVSNVDKQSLKNEKFEPPFRWNKPEQFEAEGLRPAGDMPGIDVAAAALSSRHISYDYPSAVQSQTGEQKEQQLWELHMKERRQREEPRQNERQEAVPEQAQRMIEESLKIKMEEELEKSVQDQKDRSAHGGKSFRTIHENHPAETGIVKYR